MSDIGQTPILQVKDTDRKKDNSPIRNYRKPYLRIGFKPIFLGLWCVYF